MVAQKQYNTVSGQEQPYKALETTDAAVLSVLFTYCNRFGVVKVSLP